MINRLTGLKKFFFCIVHAYIWSQFVVTVMILNKFEGVFVLVYELSIVLVCYCIRTCMTNENNCLHRFILLFSVPLFYSASSL